MDDFEAKAAVHSIGVIAGSTFSRQDRILVGMQSSLANASGTTGTASTTAVSFKGLPASYCVQVTPSQACFVSVTSKTNSGFNVVLTPITSSASISAGTFDVAVYA